ncbi:hypothetical protein QYE76_016423 [Lolium multiflorum]|uniref:ribose-5-phosphate isomerase n=2 Tax=Lolium multiflorum TaxID=4521 RepID=A0AAD8VA26_LOLMU|nr:hypothetical protein QYE76_016423 [Lolium multiflorum]
MEAVARASVAGSSHVRLPQRWGLRQRHAVPSSAACRPRGRAVACAASADADVVHLFDAAKLTVDEFVKSGMVVGLGSGAASGLAVQYLGTRLRRGSLTGIVGVPSSATCASEAEKVGIKISSNEEGPQIDFAFTDADIIEEGTLAAVIGRGKIETGEPSFIQEKGIVQSAGKVAFIIDNAKYVNGVEGSIPVLIKSGNWIDTAEEIDDLFLGDAEVWRRPSIGTAGPSGGDFPLVTKEGYHILDVIFTTPIEDLGKVAEDLENIAGVVDHGIICNTTSYAVIASKGEVQVLNQKSSVIPNT